jgi:phosphoribulokinase
MWRRYTHLDPRGNLLEAQLSALTQLQQGGKVRKRQYDHQEGRFTGPLVIAPNDFVAIVGLHPFYLGSQRELFELKIFVDPDEDLRRKWKVERDTQTRGYTREQVIEQIEKRMADSLKYVKPQMKHADVVIRQRVGAGDAPDTVDLEVELTSALDALSLMDAFDALGGLEVVWTPDEELARDRISVRGEVSGQRVGVLTRLLLPDVEELVLENAWPAGGRGLAVAATLHAISARLRSHSGEAGVP